MAVYVDGFVLPVPTARLGDYKRIARKAGKVMADPRLAFMEKNPGKMPFDGKRMFWGGFKELVRL